MRTMIIAAVLSLVVPAGTASAQEVAIALAPGETLLKVEAEGVDRRRPDTIEIDAGIVTTGASGQAAMAANAALAERLIAAVRASGIEARDVRTSALSVTPRIRGDVRDEAAAPKILGYVARNRLTLRLRDLARAPDVIDALFAAGANEVEGPRFSLADPKPAIAAGRRLAVAEARAEADAYADALGMRITRVLQVSERGAFGDPRDGSIIVTGSRLQRLPIEPGELETRVTVWIDYAMAPK